MTRTLDLLDRLIRFETVSRDSNLALIDWVQSLLSQAGFAVTRLPAPCGTKAGLFARIGPAQGGVCLSAHSDVVPVDGQPWTRPAFALTRDAQRVYGRGTTDMKGFLASALAMAEQAGRTRLREPLTLSLSYDEEVGCVGIRQMMPTLAPLLGAPRAVIVGEPTQMRIATAHKGKTALRVACHGQAGHSALAPRFVNAIGVAAQFVQGIAALQTRVMETAGDEDFTTLHVGVISGGTALNIVPDKARLEMEFRHPAGVPAEGIRAQIDALAKTLSDQHPDLPALCVTQTVAYPALETPLSDPVVGWARQMAGHDDTTRVAFGTEAGFFAKQGLPTLVIGPGDMATDGHKPDEGIAVQQLAACDQMMTRILHGLRDG